MAITVEPPAEAVNVTESQELVRSFAVARAENGFALLSEPLLAVNESNAKRWLNRANSLMS